MMPPIIAVWKARYDAKRALPSAFSLVVPSWQVFLRNWETFAEIIAVPFAVLIAGAGIGLAVHGSKGQTPGELLGGVVVLAGLLLAFAAAPTLVYTQLRSAQGLAVTYREACTASLRYFWRIWGLTLLTGLLVCVGFILLIVPGLFMLRRYLLAPYFLIDQDLSVAASMRASAETSVKQSPAVWGLIGMQCLIAAPDLLIPVFGSLITAAFGVAYLCAPALRYEEIKAFEAAKVQRKQVQTAAKKTQRRSKKKS